MTLSRRTFLRLAVQSAAGLALSACQAVQVLSTPTLEPSPTHTPPPPTITPTAGRTATATPSPDFIILAEGLDFPEGPAFDADGNAWCTELGSGNLVKVVDGGLERLDTGGKPNSMAFDREGRIVICDSGQNAIRRYDPASLAWETLLDGIDGIPLQTPNDLCFDPMGNLLFTCPNFASQEMTGYVVCLAPDGRAVKIAEGLYRPNGLEVVDGGIGLVVADTFQKTLFKGRWDGEILEWLDVIPWAVVGGAEGPDGMAFGADGLLYQAIYGDGVIRVVGADGTVVNEIQVPGMNPTNVAVDPSGKMGIVVTETQNGQLLGFPKIQPGQALFF